MKRLCCVCGVVYGEKPPLKDSSPTHGYCPPCAKAALAECGCPRVHLVGKIVAGRLVGAKIDGRTTEDAERQAEEAEINRRLAEALGK